MAGRNETLLIMEEKITFSFGKNWQKFLQSLDEERFKIAELSLTEFLRLENLRGRSFLDIGCGSGLFSYAAFNLGASRVVSFDLDAFSVECCRYLHRMAGSPENWEIYEGSILDSNFTCRLGRFDIVYAWGVLHHTGEMWRAIKNSARLVNNGGYYYIAIYNKVEGILGSRFWLRVKKLYNALPTLGKKLLEEVYILVFFAYNVARLRNPVAKIKKVKSVRGMSWGTDVTDWLGGYPYEFATADEISRFVETSFPSFSLVNIKALDGLANNWYLFKRKEN